MAYRHLKRVLGETSLERKCRFLFGACLLFLISGAFIWVEDIAEELVKKTTRRSGQDSVDLIMLRYHWQRWETDTTKKGFVEELSRDLQHRVYPFEILKLGPATNGADSPVEAIAVEEAVAGDNYSADPLQIENRNEVTLATDPVEQQILRDLKEAYEKQLAEQRLKSELLENSPESLGASEEGLEQLSPVNHLRWQQVTENSEDEDGEYHYYQPIYWKESCNRCHSRLLGGDALSATDTPLEMEASQLPFRVVKVILPVRDTQREINWARAILLAAGILTVSVAMIALYVIVRYVIVRPLKHLRDVSDAVSRGDLTQRAEIETRDEFEELATSFNRMLRHLVDAQVELKDVNGSLDAKVDELARMNMRLYENNRLKSDFLANMSHELRTPLNSIIGFSEVLEGIDSLTDKQKRYARNIQKSGRLLLEMINDILDLAKIEAGKMDVRPSEFVVSRVIQGQCDMVRSLTEDKSIELDVQTQPAKEPMYSDQAKVQQILTNLLSNAIKFTPEGGCITVKTRHNLETDSLLMEVTDTGVGIAPEDHESIFEKFRQGSVVHKGDGLTREFSGTGLGLSIVKELSRLLGGEVYFESKLGKGSSFFVELPWTVPSQPHADSELKGQLDDLTKPRRADFSPSESGEAIEIRPHQTSLASPATTSDDS
jgi:two-component system sensor histidine kinase BarA